MDAAVRWRRIVFDRLGGTGSEGSGGGVGGIGRVEFAAQRLLWRRNLSIRGRRQGLAESRAKKVRAHRAGGGGSAGFESDLCRGRRTVMGAGRRSRTVQID